MHGPIKEPLDNSRVAVEVIIVTVASLVFLFGFFYYNWKLGYSFLSSLFWEFEDTPLHLGPVIFCDVEFQLIDSSFHI